MVFYITGAAGMLLGVKLQSGDIVTLKYCTLQETTDFSAM